MPTSQRTSPARTADKSFTHEQGRLIPGPVVQGHSLRIPSKGKAAFAAFVLFFLVTMGQIWLPLPSIATFSAFSPPENVASFCGPPWREVAPILNVQEEIPAWLKDYVTFHAASLAKARNATSKNPDTNSYLIFFCTKKEEGSCSGTANQQRAIFAALMVSILTKRVFLIDIDRPVRLDEILGPNLIEWNFSIPLQSKMKTEKILDQLPPVLNSPSRFMPGSSSQVIYIRTKEPPQLDDLWATTDVQSFLGTYNQTNDAVPEAVYKWLFYTLYKPTPLLIRHMITITANLSLSDNSTYVGVHVRTGDTQFHPDHNEVQIHGGESLASFLQCASELKRRCQFANTTPTVAVADKASTRAELAAMDPLVRYVDTKIVHVDLSSDNDIEGSLNVWSDIFLLARANCTVTSYASSYGRLGSQFLGNSRCTTEVGCNVQQCQG